MIENQYFLAMFCMMAVWNLYQIISFFQKLLVGKRVFVGYIVWTPIHGHPDHPYFGNKIVEVRGIFLHYDSVEKIRKEISTIHGDFRVDILSFCILN